MKIFLAALTVLVVLTTAVPTFAVGKQVKCGGCHGSGWVPCQPNTPVFNYRRDKKGRQVRVPPYYRPCPTCGGTGKRRCPVCGGRGERYIQVAP